MIVSIDGYDGTGKTTLAKKLCEKYGFIFVERPIILMSKEKYNCSYDDAVKYVYKAQEEIYATKNIEKITRFFNDAILWLKKYQKDKNIILDRGILTSYAVTGSLETESLYDEYISNGAFFDASIYLTANDEERVRRIYERNPNDPDLKHSTKWRQNNLEEYAESRNLNIFKIDTNNKTTEEVFEQAINIFDKFILKSKLYKENYLDENIL